MSKELWIALLTFVAGAFTLATQLLTLDAGVTQVVVYLVAIINLALAVFFGYTGVQARRAAQAAKK